MLNHQTNYKAVAVYYQQEAIIDEYINSEQYNEAVQKVSETAFQGLIEEITPTLSKEQADKLQSYLKSFEPVNTSPHF